MFSSLFPSNIDFAVTSNAPSIRIEVVIMSGVD